METSVAFLVECAVKDGQLETFQALMGEMVTATSEEPGARSYEWYIADDGGTVHLWEKYADADAALTHVQGFGANWLGRFAGCCDVTSFTVYGSPNETMKGMIAGWKPSYLGAWGGFAR